MKSGYIAIVKDGEDPFDPLDHGPLGCAKHLPSPLWTTAVGQVWRCKAGHAWRCERGNGFDLVKMRSRKPKKVWVRFPSMDENPHPVPRPPKGRATVQPPLPNGEGTAELPRYGERRQ